MAEPIYKYTSLSIHLYLFMFNKKIVLSKRTVYLFENANNLP